MTLSTTQAPPIFFDGFGGLAKMLVVTPIVYLAVIAFIRLSGKRSTSQMNNFDWIVTVAMGSMIASPILLDEIVVAEGLMGIVLLLLLQYIVTKLSQRIDVVERLVKATPALVLHDGEFVRAAMRKERITESEILSAIRESGMADRSEVKAVVLETDAKLSVIAREACEGRKECDALSGLRGFGAGDDDGQISS